MPIGANSCLLETELICLVLATRPAGGLLLDLAAALLFCKVDRGLLDACNKIISLLVK